MAPAAYSELREPWLPGYLFIAVLLSALLAGLGAWLDGEYARMRVAGQLVDDISGRRVHALSLVAALRKAETAQRGYVITGNPAFLQSYAPSRQVVSTDLAMLDTPAAMPELSEPRVAQVRALVREKFAEMDEVLARMRAEGQRAAFARVSNGVGQSLTDRIEAELQAIIIRDADRLAKGRAAFWDRTYRSRQLVWLLVVTFVPLLLLGTLLLWLSRRERWRTAIAEADASVRNRAILDSTSDAIVILNPSGTIESVNASARTVLGYEPGELSRRDVSVVIDIADGDGSFHERIGLVDGQLRRTLFLDRHARTKDGRIVPVDVALGLMQVPDGLHVVASIRDISHRREIERIKDDFIATVSHELRTPLTSVVGSLGLLRGGAVGALPAKASQLVEIAENNARRLIRLTNDILDLEKFSSGKMTLEPAQVDLVDIVNQAVTEIEVAAAAKGVAFRLEGLDTSFPIMADRQRLLQVAANLLSNAVRHTRADSTVTIRLEPDDDRVITRIADQGPGVPMEYRKHIFDRFVQAPTPGAVGGSGLGLAIAREIVSRHGGDIWVDSAAGGGAVFAFSLPQHKAVEEAAEGVVAKPVTAGLEARRPTVLQIDDDIDLVEIVASALAGKARVIRAHDLASARAVLELGWPDVVVLDMGLPDGSGAEILPLLMDRTGRRVPAIVFSAQDCPQDVRQRVDAVLLKSHNTVSVLRDTILRILSQRDGR